MSDPTGVRLADPDTAALQNLFFVALPRIARHARFYFRYLKREHDHDDAVALALAWKWFIRLVQQGKHPKEFVSAIAAFAARAVKGGRRLCGQEKANDVLSRQAQARRGFLVSRFPRSRRRCTTTPPHPCPIRSASGWTSRRGWRPGRLGTAN